MRVRAPPGVLHTPTRKSFLDEAEDIGAFARSMPGFARRRIEASAGKSTAPSRGRVHPLEDGLNRILPPEVAGPVEELIELRTTPTKGPWSASLGVALRADAASSPSTTLAVQAADSRAGR